MAKATLVSEGKSIDHTAASDLAAGDVVVVGQIVGITSNPIASGALGALHLSGIFDMAKDTATAITAGARVYWDVADQELNTTASGNLLVGCAVDAATAEATTVRVLFGQYNI